MKKTDIVIIGAGAVGSALGLVVIPILSKKFSNRTNKFRLYT